MASKDEIVVSSRAYVLMALHASKHRDAEVHGILLGSRSGNKVQVSDAYAVCHETPTRPVVEAALAVAASNLGAKSDMGIIGWYTAPALKADEKPGPVALRVVASLDDASAAPVLLTLNNGALATLLEGAGTLASETLRGFGKDFGKQWLDEVPIAVSSDESAGKDFLAARVGGSPTDLIEHWQDLSTEWHGSEGLSL